MDSKSTDNPVIGASGAALTEESTAPVEAPYEWGYVRINGANNEDPSVRFFMHDQSDGQQHLTLSEGAIAYIGFLLEESYKVVFLLSGGGAVLRNERGYACSVGHDLSLNRARVLYQSRHRGGHALPG